MEVGLILHSTVASWTKREASKASDGQQSRRRGGQVDANGQGFRLATSPNLVGSLVEAA